MSSAIDETIKEIAVKHGVSVGRDDPILILQTMHERLIEQQNRAQQELLAQFKSEIEQISYQWKDDAKEKSENILNSALSASKSSLDEILNNAAKEHTNLIKAEILKSIMDIKNLNRETKAISKISFILSSTILIASCAFAAFMFWF